MGSLEMVDSLSSTSAADSTRQRLSASRKCTATLLSNPGPSSNPLDPCSDIATPHFRDFHSSEADTRLLDRRFDTQDGLYDLAWSEVHENQIATASGDGSVKLWDLMLNVGSLATSTRSSNS